MLSPMICRAILRIFSAINWLNIQALNPLVTLRPYDLIAFFVCSTLTRRFVTPRA